MDRQKSLAMKKILFKSKTILVIWLFITSVEINIVGNDFLESRTKTIPA